MILKSAKELGRVLRIYVLGPMTLYKDTDWGFANFEKAKHHIASLGHIPVVPSDLDRTIWGFNGHGEMPASMTRHVVYKIDLEVLQTCDATYALRDWEVSVGGIGEKAVAQYYELLAYEEEGAAKGRVGLVEDWSLGDEG